MDINLIKKEDLGKGSNIILNVCETEVDMYWRSLKPLKRTTRRTSLLLWLYPTAPLAPTAE